MRHSLNAELTFYHSFGQQRFIGNLYVVGTDLSIRYTLNNSDTVLDPLDLQTHQRERK